MQQVAKIMIDHDVAMGRSNISVIWTHRLSRLGERERDIWVKIDAHVPPPPPPDPGHLVAGLQDDGHQLGKGNLFSQGWVRHVWYARR